MESETSRAELPLLCPRCDTVKSDYGGCVSGIQQIILTSRETTLPIHLTLLCNRPVMQIHTI